MFTPFLSKLFLNFIVMILHQVSSGMKKYTPPFSKLVLLVRIFCLPYEQANDQKVKHL